jgi:hypothetical protein
MGVAKTIPSHIIEALVPEGGGVVGGNDGGIGPDAGPSAVATPPLAVARKTSTSSVGVSQTKSGFELASVAPRSSSMTPPTDQ